MREPFGGKPQEKTPLNVMLKGGDIGEDQPSGFSEGRYTQYYQKQDTQQRRVPVRPSSKIPTSTMEAYRSVLPESKKKNLFHISTNNNYRGGTPMNQGPSSRNRRVVHSADKASDEKTRAKSQAFANKLTGANYLTHKNKERMSRAQHPRGSRPSKL